MDNLLRFFLPAFDGSVHSVLQVSFAVVFLLVLLTMPQMIRRSATPAAWEARYRRLDSSAQGAGYSSAEELAAAVATPVERWADVLPGLLLVFGLLGTFIGLGLALTEAAGALAGGSDALGNLTPIMDSLGSKFKTSTWGILAFLGLKVWLMIFPYEDLRHAWAAARLRETTARNAEQGRLEQEAERAAVMNAIVAAVDGVRNVLQEGKEQMRSQVQENHAAHISVLRQLVQSQQQAALRQAEQGSTQIEALQLMAGQVAATTARQEAMQADVGKLAAHGGVLADQGLQQLERLAELAAQMAASRSAMERFTGDVRENVGQMSSAAGQMASSADNASHASGDLRDAALQLKTDLKSVLEDVKSTLGTSIEAMSGRFAEDMSRMAGHLQAATGGIEHAIGGLSAGVSTTIVEMQKSSDKSMELQGKAHAAFRSSSDTLNASILNIQKHNELLSKEIVSGLESISKGNAKMTALARRYEAREKLQGEMIEKIDSVARGIGTIADEKMRQAADNVSQLARVIEAFTGTQQSDHGRMQQQSIELDRIVSAISGLTDAIGDSTGTCRNAFGAGRNLAIVEQAHEG